MCYNIFAAFMSGMMHMVKTPTNTLQCRYSMLSAGILSFS